MTQKQLNADLLPFSKRDISRWKFRFGLFHSRGLSDPAAGYWADRLALRDQQHDDRRVCIECANLNGKRCKVGETVADVLQRCTGFKFEVPQP